MREVRERGIKGKVTSLQIAEFNLLRAKDRILKRQYVNPYRLNEIEGKLSNVQAKLYAIYKEHDAWGVLS